MPAFTFTKAVGATFVAMPVFPLVLLELPKLATPAEESAVLVRGPTAPKPVVLGVPDETIACCI